MINYIYIFGNEDLSEDSFPIKVLPALKKEFPEIKFEIKDPNEDWEIPNNLVIIDTVVGIKNVTIFDDLEEFAKIPRVSMHDFDALTNLRYLKKLGKIGFIKIVGIPPTKYPDKSAEDRLLQVIHSL